MADISKTSHFFSINKDFMGFAASMLCAVHCAALPLILTLSALSGLQFLANHAIEFVFIGISGVLAVWSLIPSYRWHHGNLRPLMIVGVGFSLLLASRFLPHGFTEHFITAIGGCFIAVAHLINWRLMKKLGCC